MPDDPYLSILIPYYHGSKVIELALKSALQQTESDIEIVLSIDDHINSDFIPDVSKDSRVKIFRHQKRLGMRQNYDFLVKQASGEWITILGQDDSMLPFACEQLKRCAKLYPTHDIVVAKRAYYFWPSVLSSTKSFAIIYQISGSKPTLADSNTFLKKVILGFYEYSEGPQLYTGCFVKKTLVERITKLNKGELFRYPIPDVSSAADLLLNSKSFVYLKLPLFLIGTSELSNGLKISNLIKSGANIDNLLNEAFSSPNSSGVRVGQNVFVDKTFYFYEAITDQDKKYCQYAKWVAASLVISNKRFKESPIKARVILSFFCLKPKSVWGVLVRSLVIRIIRQMISLVRVLVGVFSFTTAKLIVTPNLHELDVLKEMDKIHKKVQTLGIS